VTADRDWKLPKAEQEVDERQTAMEALMLVATLGGPTMFARIGIMRALNRHVERVFNPDRKGGSWRAIGDEGPCGRTFTIRRSRFLNVST
jgi:hypothetical protein